MSRGQRVASIIGILAGLTLFVLAAFIAPDDGPDIDGVLIGVGLGAVVAGPSMAGIVSREKNPIIVSLSGGMVIAGVATTRGGNWAGLVMAVVGLLLLAGAIPAPRPSRSTIALMLGYAAVLVIGVIAAFSAGIGTLVAVVIGVVVATSPRWLPIGPTISRPGTRRREKADPGSQGG